MKAIPALSIRLHGSISARKCVELAEIAESAGLSAAWFAENAFARGILPAAAACATATRSLGIRAGVFNPFSRHPTMMAMEVAALDELSDGRVGMSIGAGIGSAVEKIGGDASKPLGALRDTIEIVRAMLAGQTIDYQGKAFCARQVGLSFPSRSDVPIFLAGRGEKTLKLCGELADGLIISNMSSVGYASKSASAVNEAARQAGRERGVAIVQYIPCSVRNDRGEALTHAKRMLGELVPSFWSLSQKVASAKDALFLDTGLSPQDFEEASGRIRKGEDAAVALDDRFVAAFAIAGTPKECVAQAARYASAGVTEIALTFDDECSADDVCALGNAARSGQIS